MYVILFFVLGVGVIAFSFYLRFRSRDRMIDLRSQGKSGPGAMFSGNPYMLPGLVLSIAILVALNIIFPGSYANYLDSGYFTSRLIILAVVIGLFFIFKKFEMIQFLRVRIFR